MSLRLALLIVCAAGVGLVRAGADQAGPDPFAFLRPTVAFTLEDERQLDAGSLVVRVLPAESGEISVALAVRTSANGARLAAWVRAIAALKRGPYVNAIARFSSPPAAADVRDLVLDDADLQSIRACRPRSCDVKLSESEIATLQATIRAAGGQWRPAVQQAMRGLVVERVTSYLTSGHAGLGPYVDQGTPMAPADAFAAVLRHSTFIGAHVSELAAHPRVRPSGVESFAYWAIERIGGRPSLTATDVALGVFDAADRPEAVVVGTQIFSTHYVTGAVNVTAILRGRTQGARYLVYVNRSRVDVLERWYGGLARRLIAGRIRDDAASVFRALKARIESGEPPR